MRKNGKGAVKTAPLFNGRTHGGGKIAAFGGTGEPVFTGGKCRAHGGGIVGAHRQGQKGARAPYGSLAPS